TVLTPEDFEKADIESDDITSYMTAMIAKSATNQLASFPGITIDTTRLPIDKFWGPGRDTVYCKQAPLLKTKWHQNSPYNNACSADINQYGILQHCKAGCVAIATAQILKHNINGRYITISGDTFDKFLLDGCNYGSNQSYAAQSEAARFVYKIGVYLNTDYGLDSSIAYTEYTPPLFQHTGYQSVSLRSFTLTNARDMICNKQYVFYMSGIQKGSSAGHAWVIDGWNEYTVRYWNCYYDTHGGTDMEILDRVLLESRTYTKVHCNFGWGGMCDGYYSGDMFDTTKWLDRDDIDTSVGDYAGSAGQMFNSNLQMITYSLQ
ncbi:MAG: C10 family peptidase, partial [Alistipes sp.]|nr:C10 family peptidase [Alistipes sp.]